MAREVKTAVTNAVLYVDGLIRIDNVRLSYPHLHAPWCTAEDLAKGKTPAYGAMGLLDKKTHMAAKNLIKARIEELCAEHKVKAVAADKKFMKDGDLAAKEECEGMYTVSARETNAPKLRDRKGNVVTPEKARELLYAGCYVNMLIRPWFQNHKDHGKRVNAGLVAVQFFKDGEPFGEGRISDDDVDEAFEGTSADEEGFEDDTEGL